MTAKRSAGSVGIIGAGRIGQAMARIALRAGRTVVISNSRGPETLKAVVEMLGDGVSAGTVEEASAAAVVVLAVPWGNVRDAMKGLEWNGQVVIVFLSGDDVDSKSEVIALFADAGYVTIDLGSLASGGVLQRVRGPLVGVNLIRL
jgi:predicted dinucleotide-binding enzyme